MTKDEFISLSSLCKVYEIEMTFFTGLHDTGLIEIRNLQQDRYIHENEVSKVEKIIRMHRELEINPEGIDTIFNLLERIEKLQDELNEMKNRLRIYESGRR